MNKIIPDDAKKVHNGIKFDIYHWEQDLFDGSKATFERVSHSPSVQVIAIKGDKIILLDEEQPFSGEFTSLIGGGIDGNEDAKTAAKRELLEETGMECDKMEFIEIIGEGGHIHWDTSYFIARNCKKIKEQNLDAGEKIKLLELSFEEFIETISKENFRNKTFALKMLRMHYNNELENFKELLLGIKS